jgi:cell division protein FtsI/penicillin-binding protein 2
MRWRFNITLIILFVLGTAITGWLFFLQFVKHDFYKALAEGQQKILELTAGSRGEIFLANGEPLAINKRVSFLFISPKEIRNKEETARILAELLGLDEQEILEKAKKTNLFEVIKPELSEEEENKIKEKNLKGVYVQEKIVRYYPQRELASHVVGFLGGEKKGQYGVEGFYDQILKGKEVLSEKEKGPFGFFSPKQMEYSGQNLVLTIDPAIQFRAEKILQQAQARLKFKKGEILVLDPLSGEIIALAQFPEFDPNHYSEIEDISVFRNDLVQATFEPGSVFKPIVMAAGLNEGVITPQTIYIDNGMVRIGKWQIYNYNQRVFGKQTMTGVLEKSINTGAVFAERQVGHNLFLEYIKRFGFFEKTNIDLQGEVYSENLELKKGYEINFATASFGQGINVTPIQLARAFSVIANGGELITPHIVKTDQELEKKQVISRKTASELTAMLVSVIENGFGKAAGIDGYFVAGKTGTAQIAWPALGIQKSGYSDQTIQTFVGFAPAFDPKFLILIKLDNPATRTAEYSAVPLFKELAKYIIDLWEIPPDH